MTEAAAGTLEQALAHAQRLLERDATLAREPLGEILKAVAGHPDALRLQAVAHLALGEDAAALGILAPLAAARPNS